MHHHCSITAPSLHRHCTITTSSSPGGVCSVLPATALPLSSPPAGSSEALKESLSNHTRSPRLAGRQQRHLCCAMLYHHCTSTIHHTITMSSTTGGGTHTQLGPLQVPSLYLDALRVSLCTVPPLPRHCAIPAPSPGETSSAFSCAPSCKQPHGHIRRQASLIRTRAQIDLCSVSPRHQPCEVSWTGS